MAGDSRRAGGPAALVRHKFATRGDLLWRKVQFAWAYTGLIAPWLVPPPHPSAGGFVLALILGLVVCGVVGASLKIGDFTARLLASKVTRPRRRWQYFAFSLGYAALAAAFAAVRATQAHTGRWAQTATVELAVLAGVAAATAFGRGALRGRLRRLLWRYPPPGLAPATERIAAPRAAPGGQEFLPHAYSVPESPPRPPSPARGDPVPALPEVAPWSAPGT